MAFKEMIEKVRDKRRIMRKNFVETYESIRAEQSPLRNIIKRKRERFQKRLKQ